MKKIFAFLLSLVYLVSSNGATLNFHYCMGRFIGVDVSASEAINKTCTKCGMTKENRKGCCNDKQETIKLNNDQLLSAIIIAGNNLVKEINRFYPSFEHHFITACSPVFHSAHSPPLSAAPLFILHCVFRI